MKMLRSNACTTHSYLKVIYKKKFHVFFIGLTSYTLNRFTTPNMIFI